MATLSRKTTPASEAARRTAEGGGDGDRAGDGAWGHADDLEGARGRKIECTPAFPTRKLQGLLVAAVHRHLRLQVARHVGVLAAKLLCGERRELTSLGSG